MDNSSEWLTMDELMAYLKVSRQTVLNWIEGRNLPGNKIGKMWRFNKDDINAWIRKEEN